MFDKEALANYIHVSKYGKYIPDLHRRETFKETVLRVRRMHKSKFPKLKKEIDKAFEMVLQKKVLPSMRSMQFAGEPLKERNERMYNCSFTLIDRPDVFGKILYLLLCGVGVGYSVQKQHVAKLPKLKQVDKGLVCHHIVEDTIEGWADAVGSLIKSFINGYNIEFSYHKIRPQGSQLKSGGRAPGHMDLRRALEATRRILKNAQNRKLKPIECHDIICHLSKAVLAGGIRRSSLIALFSKDDDKMMFCKEIGGEFEFNGRNSQRALCNNSVVLNPHTCTEKELRFILELNQQGIGEPGFIFLEDEDTGINPCGEIGINPTWMSDFAIDMNTKVENLPLDQYKVTGFGFCNLVEINAAGCKDEQDFYNACHAASFIATLQASYTRFPYLGEISEQIAKRDALIGVSITGMMDAKFDIFNHHILHTGAERVKTQNEVTAKEIGINPAVRCTCIKPSGTSSLELGGVSTGIHPQISKNYLKRITANPLEPVAQFFASVNPHMVEKKPNDDLCLVFPIETKGKTILDFTASEFINKVIHVYNNWILPTHKSGITHNVSCTVTVQDHEWESLLTHIWINRFNLRCLTFLSYNTKHIPFMPNEPIFPTDHRWRKLVENYKPVDYELMEEHEDTTLRGAACDGPKCGLEDRTFIKGDGYRVFEGESGFSIGTTWEEHGLKWKMLSQGNGYFIGQRI